MAEVTIPGKNVLVWVKRETDTDFQKVMCQIDLNVPFSRDVNTEKTKCGVSKTLSELDANATMNVEYRKDTALEDGEISGNDLRDMIINGDNFEVEIKDTSSELYLHSANCELSDFEMTADSETSTKFSCTIQFLTPADIETVPST